MTTFVEEYRGVVDKAEWGPGPWQDEPDKAVWVDETTGLDCMIVRNHYGALCGYVGIPEGHPLHGRDYNDVHGGLTFADACHPSDDDPGRGICHIPQPGRPDSVWWFGFDCTHAFDVAPRMAADNRKRYEEAKTKGDLEGMRIWRNLEGDGPMQSRYRSLPYVIEQVEGLAHQLAASGGEVASADG